MVPCPIHSEALPSRRDEGCVFTLLFTEKKLKHTLALSCSSDGKINHVVNSPCKLTRRFSVASSGDGQESLLDTDSQEVEIKYVESSVSRRLKLPP
jgi:hypothetical protein